MAPNVRARQRWAWEAARNAALSEDSRQFVLEQMINARQSVSTMQTDLVVSGAQREAFTRLRVSCDARP